jgi:hypothetical protein
VNVHEEEDNSGLRRISYAHGTAPKKKFLPADSPGRSKKKACIEQQATPAKREKTLR